MKLETDTAFLWIWMVVNFPLVGFYPSNLGAPLKVAWKPSHPPTLTPLSQLVSLLCRECLLFPEEQPVCERACLCLYVGKESCSGKSLIWCAGVSSCFWRRLRREPNRFPENPVGFWAEDFLWLGLYSCPTVTKVPFEQGNIHLHLPSLVMFLFFL